MTDSTSSSTSAGVKTAPSFSDKADEITQDFNALDVLLSRATGSQFSSEDYGKSGTKGIPSGNKPTIDTPNGMSSEILLMLVANVAQKLQMLTTEAEHLGLQEKGDRENDAHLQKMEETKKTREAHSKVDVIGIIATIFSWVAAVAAIAAAAVVAVVSFGTASALVGCIAVVGLALAITTTALTMSGAMKEMNKPLANALTNLFEQCGMDPKIAKLVGEMAAELIASLVIIAIQIALTVGTLGASGGSAVAGIASKITKLSAKAAEIGAKVGSGLAATAGVVSGVASVGKGAADIAKGAYTKEELDHQAGQIEFQQIVDTLQARMEATREFISMIYRMLGENIETVNDIIELASKSRQQLISSQKSYA